MPCSEYDVVVIGAGLYGIATAAFFLEIHPECQLLILDRDSHLGGTWNARRLYDTFRSQIGIGMAEFPDMPLKRPPEDEIVDEFCEARRLTQYLEDYVDSHVYAGKSLRERIILGYDVSSVNKRDGGWRVHGHRVGDLGEEDNEHELGTIVAKKLIVATGLTSDPLMPALPKKECFRGPIVHQVDFGESKILSSSDIKNVTVLGGAKSAADMVYASVKAGKSVTWVVRKSGAGPAAFFSAEGKGPYKNSPEMGATRWIATFNPSVFTKDRWSTWFMNRTMLGKWLVDGLWNNARKVPHAVFDSGIEAKDGFQDLRPKTEVFWCNDSLGLIQHRDFWSVVAKNVQIYHKDVECLGENFIRLEDGMELKTDAILCGTGWSRSHKIFNTQQAQALGISYPVELNSISDSDKWRSRDLEADKEILRCFPRLANPPSEFFHKPTTSAPYRLYNLIAPVSEEEQSDRSIAFVGCVQVPNSFHVAQIQAIWTTAYLTKQLNLPTLEERMSDVSSVVTWNRRRYLNNGALGNYLHYDMINYTDRLLEELGLSSHLNGKTWWQQMTLPCFARDYRDMSKEYKNRFGAGGNTEMLS